MAYFFLLVLMTMLGSVAALFLKKASVSVDLKGLIKNTNLYLGGILYVIAAIINVYILRFLEYSVVLPLTSLTYLWTIVLSHLILKEKITANKIIGVTGILIGAILITG
jgi:drug/metabolite transporter (DMT)-like permease